MSDTPSRSVRLFETDQPVAPPRLKAGPLTAEFEVGNLRYIRFSGLEMMGATSFVVRDKNWGNRGPTGLAARLGHASDAQKPHPA